VVKSNRALSATFVLATVFLLSGVAQAQSVLNFATRGLTGIALTNTTSSAAEVKFTLYNSDGSTATTAVLNPISRRVPAKGQIAVLPSEAFRMKEGARQDTWIQAASSVTGLQGFYFTGDFVNAFDGAEASEPQLVQTIPYLRSDPRASTSIFVTNPGSQTANVTVTFYNELGRVVTAAGSFPLEAHGQLVFSAPSQTASARVTADAGVLATAVERSGNSLAVINGQGPKSQAQRFVAPYFKNGENTDSHLILVNPTDTEVEATVRFFTDLGVPTDPRRFTITANGSLELDGSAIMGVSIPHEGWLSVESDSPIIGTVLVRSASSRTTLSLQTAPSDGMLFSRFTEGGFFSSTLTLVGSAERDATVVVTLTRPDGTIIARRELAIPPAFRLSGKIRDLLPISDRDASGYITVQSSIPIYAVELMDVSDGLSQAGLNPQDLSAGFQALVGGRPRIATVVEETDAPFGVRRIRITGENLGNNATLYVNGRIVPMSPVGAIGATGDRYTADLPPDLDPGFINVKIRANGLESNVETLDSVVPENAVFIRRQGQAMYQKVEVTDTGLDLSRPVFVPIRHARVEIFDLITRQVVSVAETDEEGWFFIGVPDRNALQVRVLSRLRSSEVKVVDNTASGRPTYALIKDIDDPASKEILELIDSTRQAGAFNILDGVQRGNALIAQGDPQLIPPPLTIFWSQNNNESVISRLTGGQIKTTFFHLATNTAYVLGDRNTDSDEFDDSVILHEYAHMLAGRFSRDDSIGGPHNIGDLLDPRLAWSEGWANFFSSAVRGTSIYLDSKGPGIPTVRFDVEDNVPPNDRPGYRSEASVAGLLWDLVDENADKDDLLQLPFAAVWNAFTDLRNIRYVYLPYFLESFLAKNPGLSDALRTMVVARSIDFQPEGRPSVTDPFPTPITVGIAGSTQGSVDSFTSRRWNLALSSHFYTFTTAAGGAATISLNIEGLGPANNAGANDLDLYLYDGNGRRLEKSARAFNGQSELISGIRLTPGTYYVEVRSFFTRADTNTMFFNSGNYRLTVQMQ